MLKQKQLSLGGVTSKLQLTVPPFKVVIIERKDEYCRTIWCAIGIGLAHVMIGASIMTSLIYSLETGDEHAILCCLGYSFFSAEAILSLKYRSGWSTPMRLGHRRVSHVLLQICALISAGTGTVLAIIKQSVSGNVHGVTGLMTAVLALLCLVTGPLVLYQIKRKSTAKVIHMSFGMLAFVMSSLSFGFGLWTPAFKAWTVPATKFIVASFIIFFTTLIMSTTFINCMKRI